MNASSSEVELLFSSIPPRTILFDRYRIENKLGEGGIAAVYLAHDERLDERVALKILDPLRGNDPVGRARFEREFEVLSKLDHSGIARCFRMESSGQLDVLVLEYIEGDSLAARIGHGRLDAREATAITVELARALGTCHRQGILHRDLKPANIILHPQRGPVILDFGVAWFTSAATLTRTGSIIGSPQYIAPEAFRSPNVDARADVYALGMILFEMIAGYPARIVDSLAEMAIAHFDSEAPMLSTARPNIDPRLDRIVARAIAVRPEQRYATAGELELALTQPTNLVMRSLEPRIPCTECTTPLIVELPFCPGCGRAIDWNLRPGAYAVQLTEIDGTKKCIDWIMRRHRSELRTSPVLAERRLEFTPVPLAVGVSRVSADQLLSEAEEAGAKGDIVRARAIVGARLQASNASELEIGAACAVHFTAVFVLCKLALLLGTTFAWVAALPAICGAIGIVLAVIYVRRPLLHCPPNKDQGDADPRLERFQERLRRLTTERARSIAAGAVQRATPVLLGEVPAMSSDACETVKDDLQESLDAAVDLDAHARVLFDYPRSRLAAEMTEARARAERGVMGADEQLRVLIQTERELTETAVAHDLAARRALEACESLTRTMSSSREAARELS